MPDESRYESRTQFWLHAAAPQSRPFSPEEALRRLLALSTENAFWTRLQACFPENMRRTDLSDAKTLALQRTYLDSLAGTRNISTRQFKEWLRGNYDIQVHQGHFTGSVSQTREQLYAFCALLGYNYQQTVDFFWKVAFAAPFKRKVWTEAVYYYFARVREEKDWYGESRKVIDRLWNTMERALPEDALSAQAEEASLRDTAEVEWAVEHIQSAEELEWYLTTDTLSFHWRNFNKTARNMVCELYESCLPYAASQAEEDAEKMTGEAVLHTILGADFSKDRLAAWPEVIARGFPSKEILARIRRGYIGRPTPRTPRSAKEKKERKITDTELRKMLLLLEFYAFYAQLRASRAVGYDVDHRGVFHKIEGYSEKRDEKLDYSDQWQAFCDDANDKLMRCGFVGLYPGNPYDDLFLLAASARSPIKALPQLLRTTFPVKTEMLSQ